MAHYFYAKIGSISHSRRRPQIYVTAKYEDIIGEYDIKCNFRAIDSPCGVWIFRWHDLSAWPKIPPQRLSIADSSL